MDLARKSKLAKDIITSISRHDDEDSTVRKAMLAELVAFLGEEEDAIDARVAARVAALNDEG